MPACSMNRWAWRMVCRWLADSRPRNSGSDPASAAVHSTQAGLTRNPAASSVVFADGSGALDPHDVRRVRFGTIAGQCFGEIDLADGQAVQRGETRAHADPPPG